ncbi:MAG: prolyl oligopeptidase family serine peptidase [Myxococcales bacterium]|nr:prolyl oligopeptidase family serine peptidase [Myxococcales bacterium]
MASPSLPLRPWVTLSSFALVGAIACSGTDDGGGGGGGGDAGPTGGGAPVATGGAGTGGAVLGSGGGFASGGSTGGDPSTGGAPFGSGGDDSGGGGSDSGSGGGTPVGSPGCGAMDHPTSGKYTIQVNGKTREYTLDVPNGYDPNTPYPLTFGLHWRYGNSGDVVNNGYYGLKQRAGGGMIFVSPEGLTPDGVSGWANTGGEDVEFVALMLDRFEQELCIDTERVFATGFSYGGMFSNAIGCALADRFRAIAPYAGSLWSGCVAGATPIAYFGTHGVQDSVVPISAGRDARDEFLSRNGCSSSSSPVGSNGCVRYEGCDADNPLVWCEFTGDHTTPGFAADEVWAFFSSF